MSEDKLNAFLKTGKEWSRLRTSVPGIFVLRLPAYRSSPVCLAVELNPVNDGGNPKKRRGLILRSSAEREDFKGLFLYETMPKLLGMIDSVNPKIETAKRRKGEEVLEL